MFKFKIRKLLCCVWAGVFTCNVAAQQLTVVEVKAPARYVPYGWELTPLASVLPILHNSGDLVVRIRSDSYTSPKMTVYVYPKLVLKNIAPGADVFTVQESVINLPWLTPGSVFEFVVPMIGRGGRCSSVATLPLALLTMPNCVFEMQWQVFFRYGNQTQLTAYPNTKTPVIPLNWNARPGASSTAVIENSVQQVAPTYPVNVAPSPFTTVPQNLWRIL
jgi:hypothetical protein